MLSRLTLHPVYLYAKPDPISCGMISRSVIFRCPSVDKTSIKLVKRVIYDKRYLIYRWDYRKLSNVIRNSVRVSVLVSHLIILCYIEVLYSTRIYQTRYSRCWVYIQTFRKIGNFELELYLRSVNNFLHRTHLSRFRCSAHKLFYRKWKVHVCRNRIWTANLPSL